MITKQSKLVITFHTTEEAMMMEMICKQNQMQGRLIPVPGFISAGCGLAWCADPDQESILRTMMNQTGIKPQEIQICMI